MKKMILALSAVLFSTQAFAAATLRVPVNLYINDELTSAAVINQKLAAAGEPRIPSYIEISSGEVPSHKVAAFQVMLEKSLKAILKSDDYMTLTGGTVPTEVDTPQFFTCYKGNAQEIPEIVSGLADALYSEQMNRWGYKFKDVTVVDGEESQYLNDESALWRNWSGQGDDLLILSATNDSGDDVQESLIPKCK